VVGTTNQGGAPRSFAIARYNLNGSLDPTFSGDGKQTTGSAFGEDAGARGVAIQADGKIVAVGERLSPNDFVLARFNPNGSLDPTFSDDGLQTTNFGGEGSDAAREVAIQADGKIVAVGSARGFFPIGRDFGLARYNPDGSLDPTFSDDGLQTTDFLFDAGDDANDVAIQADGKIVAVGVARGGATGNDFGLARYNADGTLDTSFSADGRKRTNFGGSSGSLPSDGANDVALLGDGRIVAVGVGNEEFALARYLGN
jgi:uncharacterized delta-60 repeat protein